MTGPAGTGTELDALWALADSWGLQRAYHDAFGIRRVAGPESVVALLRALGAPLERPAEAGDALRARRRECETRRLEPATVAWEDEAPGARVRFRSDDPGRLTAELLLEGGERRELRLEAEELAPLGSVEVDGREVVTRRLPLPEDLPRGYHRLRLERGGEPGSESLVIRAPRRAHHGRPDRRWGVFLPLYALRTGDGGWGLGGYGGLRDLGSWTARHGGRLVGTVPLLPTWLDEPFDPSPYAPVSRLFWSEAYIDPERAPGWSPEVLDALPPGMDALEAERRALQEAPGVDWRRVMRLKREVLARLARRFFLARGERDPGFRAFLESTPLVREYARFRAAAEVRRSGWRGWPAPARDGELSPADYGADAVTYHLFVQWLAEGQLQEAAAPDGEEGAGLYLDLPLGAHPDGFDTWRFREHFALGASAGAPPDDFFREGQNWGLPPLHPERIRERGFAYTRACLRHSLRLSRALRIDHVMGLHRLFWVPEGAPASEGLYVRYPAEELWAIHCLESHRHATEVVGEDLGTVPPEVREAMEAHDVDGMYVVEFEVRADPERALPPVPRRALATLDTHDTYPFGSFWSGADIQDRKRRGLLDADSAAAEAERRQRLRGALAAWLDEMALLEGPPTGQKVLHAILAWLAASPARSLVVNLEDLWLEPRPQNLPGTPAEENWRRKARYPLDRLASLPNLGQLVRTLSRLRGGEGDVAPGVEGGVDGEGRASDGT